MAATFEDNLRQLEEITQYLEEGGAGLNETLKVFEKGIKLSRACHKELNKFEKKVEILIHDNNEIKGKTTFEE